MRFEVVKIGFGVDYGKWAAGGSCPSEGNPPFNKHPFEAHIPILQAIIIKIVSFNYPYPMAASIKIYE